MSKLDFFGRFSWVVLNEKDKIVNSCKFQNFNLITDIGLNQIGTTSYANCFQYCGISTLNNTISKSDISLQGETIRINSYLDNSDANKSYIQNNSYILRRTFVFPKFSYSNVYKSAAFSWLPYVGSYVFSKISLPDVNVDANERLLIQYELVININPNKPVNASSKIPGKICYQKIGMKSVNSLGKEDDFDIIGSPNEPSVNSYAFISADSNDFTNFGYSLDRSASSYFQKNTTQEDYIVNSYSITKRLLLNKMEANASWKCAGLGSPINNGVTYIADNVFTKSVGKFYLDFIFEWKRIDTSTLFYWKKEDDLFLKANPLLDYFSIE